MLKYSARTVTFFKQLIVRKNRGKRDAIYSVCGLIRRSAINRLKVRPGSSQEGASPHAHTLGGLRVIRFAVSGNTGIIGPVRFPNSRKYNKPVPAIQEFGGTVFTLGRVFRQVHYGARPYMSKTIETLRGRIPKEFSVQLGKVI